MEKDQSNLELFSLLSKIVPNREYFVNIPKALEEKDSVTVVGKLTAIESIYLFKENLFRMHQGKTQVIEQLLTALKYDVKGLSFSQADMVVLLNLTNTMPQGFQKMVAYINNQNTITDSELEFWVNHFTTMLEEDLKLEDLSETVKLLIFDDGIEELALIVPSEVANKQGVEVNSYFKFDAIKTRYTNEEEGYSIIFNRSIPIYEQEILTKLVLKQKNKQDDKKVKSEV